MYNITQWNGNGNKCRDSLARIGHVHMYHLDLARGEVIEKATVVGFNLIKRVSIPLVVDTIGLQRERGGLFPPMATTILGILICMKRIGLPRLCVFCNAWSTVEANLQTALHTTVKAFVRAYTITI